MFCCLHDLGSVPYIVPLIDLGRLALRVLKVEFVFSAEIKVLTLKKSNLT
jgi:hypothetical protein